jgi:hypothetical protein
MRRAFSLQYILLLKIIVMFGRKWKKDRKLRKQKARKRQDAFFDAVRNVNTGVHLFRNRKVGC